MQTKIDTVKKDVLSILENANLVGMLNKKATTVKGSNLMRKFADSMRHGKLSLSWLRNFSNNARNSEDIVLEGIANDIDEYLDSINGRKFEILEIMESIVRNPSALSITLNNSLFNKLFELYTENKQSDIDAKILMGSLSPYESIQPVRRIVESVKVENIQDDYTDATHNKYNPISYHVRRDGLVYVSINNQLYTVNENKEFTKAANVKALEPDELSIFKHVSHGVYNNKEQSLTFQTSIGECKLHLDEKNSLYGYIVNKGELLTESEYIKGVNSMRYVQSAARVKHNDDSILHTLRSLGDIVKLDNVLLVENNRNNTKTTVIIDKKRIHVLPVKNMLEKAQICNVNEGIHEVQRVTNGFDITPFVANKILYENARTEKDAKYIQKLDKLNERINEVVDAIEHIHEKFPEDKNIAEKLAELDGILQALINENKKITKQIIKNATKQK